MTLLSLVPLTIALLLSPQGEAGKTPKDAITPFIGEEVAAVIHVDLSRIDVQHELKKLLAPIPGGSNEEDSIAQIAKVADDLRNAGISRAYVLIDPLTLPGVPDFVMPGVKDPEAARQAIQKLLPPESQPPVVVEVIRGAVVVGTEESIARLRKPAKARSGLAEAFAATNDAPLSAILLPSDTQRRALEEALPELPPELGGGPIGVVTDGLKWGAVAIQVQPELNLKAVIQASDAESAKAMQNLARRGITMMSQQVAAMPRGEQLTESLKALQPEVKGDQLVMELDAAKAMRLVLEPVSAAREAARRAQCTNNLKQIGLALHNYHDSYNGFPAAYSQSKDGRPLLSWRVHILPFIEEQPLYEQFHLDEPWDSEHNKALIEMMPQSLLCPTSTLAGTGKTTYLTPRGKHTIFPGSEGSKIQEITDGTSNTIMVVEANDQNAVIWTKPDDWETGEMPTMDALLGLHPNGFNVLFGDGSVRSLNGTINVDTFRAMLTRDGGEVVDLSNLD